ncbi:GDP-mannose-dependent alpha-(1-6)-phosphatidylinositol monomannoside mannosyltransferase [Methanobrevibacter cuticularis]|uniref:GDP-mannose-dependent alpha-(1-6)-phosphatidylinositol monomannoside mannosyltransferase n=1 Tax=Methanobrevibacter cuticularis TaxID=47311 RepID=A0A166CGZ5_9EURY|nr:glycosyltransferase family 4 protein [Methanobrevibacter cuticularis]KZX14498.1 GDP-mannose-dependent alpha-(1-6)-phosphatidylinositol monomannoside mannosyltransferase [Methanobrevibacter cuticularis]
MKIGFVTEYFPKSKEMDIKGGAEVAAFNEAFYLSTDNEITVLTSYEEGMERDSQIGNIKVLACGKKRSYTQKGSFKNRLSFMKSAYDVGKKLNLDIIVGYNFITYVSAWKISKKLNIPCVARYHDVWINSWIKNVGIFGIFGEIIERYLLSRNLALIVAVSNFTAKNLENYFPKEKIATVHNIVEFNNVTSEKYNDTTISCVSRLVEYKRIEDLILAMDILVKEYPDLKCKIIGTGPMEEKIRLMIHDRSLNDNIELCGFVEKHIDVLKVINSSSIFCLPSEVEGFGIVIVEALGCEVPFVASNIPPVMEASGEKGGLFFQVRDSNDLAKKIKLILDNKDLYEKLKNEGKEQYNKYHGKYIAKKLENLYKKTIDRYNINK